MSASILLLVDLDTGAVVPLDTGRRDGYGVSWFPGSQHLVLAHTVVEMTGRVDIQSYAHSELGYVSHGPEVSGPFLSQPHQILCASDGRVICTNTGRNAISVIDLKRPGHFQEARISAARWDRLTIDETPGDHLNSVFEKDGKLYVIAHGFRKGSQLATFAYPTLELLDLRRIRNRTGLHNIWVTPEGEQVSCHSEGGALIELEKGRVLWESGGLAYLRGLAASADYVVVGEGRKAPREMRSNSETGIWIVDRRSWQTLDYLPLGWYGAVKEVRLLNVADEAHHGHQFAGIEQLLAADSNVATRIARIEAAQRASTSRNAWRGFAPICGIPNVGSESGLTADHEDLCLIAEHAPRVEPDWELAVGYRIDSAAANSHVSIVSYRGRGADTDMHALLLSAQTADFARLQLWVHDGNEWSVRNDVVYVDGLPLAGEIRVRANAQGIDCEVDGKRVALVSAQSFPWKSGSLGVRWLGATIYPRHDLRSGAAQHEEAAVVDQNDD